MASLFAVCTTTMPPGSCSCCSRTAPLTFPLAVLVLVLAGASPTFIMVPPSTGQPERGRDAASDRSAEPKSLYALFEDYWSPSSSFRRQEKLVEGSVSLALFRVFTVKARTCER
jgi:hypothetical protein